MQRPPKPVSDTLSFSVCALKSHCHTSLRSSDQELEVRHNAQSYACWCYRLLERYS